MRGGPECPVLLCRGRHLLGDANSYLNLSELIEVLRMDRDHPRAAPGHQPGGHAAQRDDRGSAVDPPAGTPQRRGFRSRGRRVPGLIHHLRISMDLMKTRHAEGRLLDLCPDSGSRISHQDRGTPARCRRRSASSARRSG